MNTLGHLPASSANLDTNHEDRTSSDDTVTLRVRRVGKGITSGGGTASYTGPVINPLTLAPVGCLWDHRGLLHARARPQHRFDTFAPTLVQNERSSARGRSNV